MFKRLLAGLLLFFFCFALPLSAAQQRKKADKKTIRIPPKVWFFFADVKGADLRSRASNYVNMEVGRYNRHLRADPKTVDQALDIKSFLCPQGDMESAAKRAMDEAWLTKEERRKGRRAVFMECRCSIHEPDKPQDRAVGEEPFRFQVDLVVNVQACNLVPSRAGLKKRKPWKREFKVKYVTPPQVGLPPGRQPETERQAVQNACRQFVKQFFLYRKKWLKR